jgi:hypothetical protein
MTVLVGADPEVFVRDKNGRFRSAHGLIQGTKEEPFKVKDGAVQVDGMALEFNIEPADTREQFIHNIGSVLGQLAKMVPDYQIAIVPTATFNGNHMRAQPEKALELGCEPDYDAYSGQQNERPNNKTTMRTAAGHVHIGFCENADVSSEEHMLRCITLVKHLDAFLGLPSLKWDQDNKRRKMYGKAGAFRPKPYGVEYRTLSNAWLRDERLVGFVFDAVQRTVEYLQSGKRIDDVALGNFRTYIDKSMSALVMNESYRRLAFPKELVFPDFEILV